MSYGLQPRSCRVSDFRCDGPFAGPCALSEIQRRTQFSYPNHNRPGTKSLIPRTVTVSTSGDEIRSAGFHHASLHMHWYCGVCLASRYASIGGRTTRWETSTLHQGWPVTAQLLSGGCPQPPARIHYLVQPHPAPPRALWRVGLGRSRSGILRREWLNGGGMVCYHPGSVSRGIPGCILVYDGDVVC
jgi:hypothetical protein